MTGTEIYKRTETYEKEAPSIRLHAPQWKLLLAYDGQRTLAEVALSIELPFAEALPLTERFLAGNWITEQPITLEQYLKRAGASGLSPIGSAVPPVVVLHEPKPENPAPSPVSTTPPVQNFSSDRPPAVVNPPAVLVPLQETSKGAVMRIGAVVNFILSCAGDGTVGQLLVYRVFLRIAPELLQRAEIASVHLSNDPGLVREPSLQEAIANAVREIVKRPLPDSVFAAA